MELVDTHALGACASRLAGSIPVPGTTRQRRALKNMEHESSTRFLSRIITERWKMEFDSKHSDNDYNEVNPESQMPTDMPETIDEISDIAIETEEDKRAKMRKLAAFILERWHPVIVEQDGVTERKWINNETNTEYDSKGRDILGYDESGRDKNGFDREGYDARGWDRNGRHRNTGEKYNSRWRDKEGWLVRFFDEEGYDQFGRDKNGFDRNGRDIVGRDRRGYNEQGWDWNGINRYTLTKYDLDGYDEHGFDENNLDREGYDPRGYNKDGVDREGYNMGGWKDGIHRKTGTNFNPKGFDENGFDRDGFNKYGINADGYHKNGMVDDDVAFAIDFMESGVGSKREYAETHEMTIEEFERRLKIARAKCQKIEAQVHDFLKHGNQIRWSQMKRDCAELLNGEIDLYGFKDKHPRLTAIELMKNLLPNDSERRVFADKVIEQIEISPENIEKNLRVFTGSWYDVKGALRELESFRRFYTRLPQGETGDATKIRREHAKKIKEIEKYFKIYKNENIESLVGMRYSNLSGTSFEFTQSDIDRAKQWLKEGKRLICLKTVREQIIADKELSER